MRRTNTKKVYLDIETTGFAYSDPITVIGMYDGHTVYQFSTGKNLDEFPAAFQSYEEVLGFNIISFDKPRLEHRFGADLFHNKVVIDLMHIAKEKGFTGGQKKIEDALNIARDHKEINGFVAAMLGKKVIRENDQHALEKLEAYNREDIKNLEAIEKKLTQY